MALLTVVGGYSLLLAWQRAGIRTAGPAPPEDLPPLPPDPRPLPPIRPTVEATGEPEQRIGRGELRVTVEGTAESDAPLGVAILDGRDGRPLGYQVLDSARRPGEIAFSAIPEGDHLVCLARSETLASYGYLDRATVHVSPDRPATVSLSAGLQDVRIRISFEEDPGAVANTLHQLSRVDDPRWRPALALPSSALEKPMLMADEDGVLQLRGLGPGHYRLELLGLASEWNIEPEAIDFRVPGPDQLEVNCRRR